jgi:hypothetical protein
VIQGLGSQAQACHQVPLDTQNVRGVPGRMLHSVL